MHEIALSDETKCRKNPLIISCKFSAVTNSGALTSTHCSACLTAIDTQKIIELRGAVQWRSEWLRVGCTTFNPLVDSDSPDNLPGCTELSANLLTPGAT